MRHDGYCCFRNVNRYHFTELQSVGSPTQIQIQPLLFSIPATRDKPGQYPSFRPVISKGLFEAPQLTGEKKPPFGSVDEALAVLLVVAGFCQLLFGNRAALGRCKK